MPSLWLFGLAHLVNKNRLFDVSAPAFIRPAGLHRKNLDLTLRSSLLGIS
jgi:hypothetical protein